MAPYRGVVAPADGPGDGAAAGEGGARLDLDPVEIRRAQPDPARRLPVDRRPPASSSTRAATTRRSRRARTRSTSTASASASGPRATRAACSGSASSASPSAAGYGTAGLPPAQDGDHARLRPGDRAHGPVGRRHASTSARPATARATTPRSPRSPPTTSASSRATSQVRQSDTDATPYGWGTFASRSMVVGGGATHRAAGALAERVRRLAAHLLEAAPRGRRAARRPRGGPRLGRPRAGPAPTSRGVAYLEVAPPARGRGAGPRGAGRVRPAGDVLQRHATAASSRSTPRPAR